MNGECEEWKEEWVLLSSVMKCEGWSEEDVCEGEAEAEA